MVYVTALALQLRILCALWLLSSDTMLFAMVTSMLPLIVRNFFSSSGDVVCVSN